MFDTLELVHSMRCITGLRRRRANIGVVMIRSKLEYRIRLTGVNLTCQLQKHTSSLVEAN
ncbi:hypothetical protein SERLADRAFT_399347 [Serpula lacrymans var. lacrymans S7.9]|uniref:Uncharacterized protein n=1 Tax=Serpula lacrymans var. lacrymans (strain S7.9) TaxID=578457 RepID=F8P7S0_SERL9|nr:uncharacterized protein SERLADRAFT_399347 [Serpula lacrymans var. lacrymans S7.9]EGO20478.1 hypothetical protein SERLADRAFT_399347 [Serpula lacrymans var. lacrymans S7.9]